MAQQWMSIIEYARQFSVSDMTVRRRIKNGKLYATLREGKYFIPVDADHRPHPEGESDFLPQTSEDRQYQGTSLIKNSIRQNSHLDFEFKNETAPRVRFESLENGRTSLAESFPMPSFKGKFPIEDEPITTGNQSIAEVLEFANKTIALAEDKFKAKELEWSARLKAQEFEVSTRDIRINMLKQQIEDLQLLVKVIESPN